MRHPPTSPFSPWPGAKKKRPSTSKRWRSRTPSSAGSARPIAGCFSENWRSPWRLPTVSSSRRERPARPSSSPTSNPWSPPPITPACSKAPATRWPATCSPRSSPRPRRRRPGKNSSATLPLSSQALAPTGTSKARKCSTWHRANRRWSNGWRGNTRKSWKWNEQIRATEPMETPWMIRPDT